MVDVFGLREVVIYGGYWNIEGEVFWFMINCFVYRKWKCLCGF